MSIISMLTAHPALGSLAERPGLHFYELRDVKGIYAAAALAEHPDCLELHLEVLRFGPCAVRSLRADARALAHMARSRGKNRVVGLRIETGDSPDPRWPKFTRLFGFTNQRVYQAAELILPPEPCQDGNSVSLPAQNAPVSPRPE